MAERFNIEDVKEALYEMMTGIVDEVHTNDRPTVKETTDTWAIVSLPYGINASSSITDYAFARIQLFYKNRENGIENNNLCKEIRLGTLAAIRRDLSEGGRYSNLMTCNDEPRVLYFKSDHMGYHAIAIQFKVIIKFLNNN